MSTTKATKAPAKAPETAAAAPADEAAVEAVIPRDHDRVAMLSLRADGSHDQLDPELILGRDEALEATKTQLAHDDAEALVASARVADE
jgi:hypothetical protein